MEGNQEPTKIIRAGGPAGGPAVGPSGAPVAGHFAATVRPSPFEDPRVRVGTLVVGFLVLAALVGVLAAIATARSAMRERDQVAGELEELRREAADVAATRLRAEAAEHRADELDARVARLLAPAAGVPWVELKPITETTGAEDEGPPALAPGSNPYVVIRLDVGRASSAAGVTIRLRDRDGGELWAAENVRSDESGLITLLVPSNQLTPGLIGVEVEGGRAPSRFRLLVRPGLG